MGIPRILLILLLLAASLHAKKKFVFEKAEMGVPFRIALYSKDQSTAKAACDAAFAHIEKLNAIFSDYEKTSEISALSRTSGSPHAIKISPPLFQILSRSQTLAKETQGAFDITSGPLTAAWRHARRTHKLPPPEQIQKLLSQTGWQKLHLDPKTQTARLTHPGMKLDLGGIAKGTACDEALRILKKNGHPSALVAASGDILAGDPPPDQPGWRILIEPLDPIGDISDTPKPEPAIILLSHSAISTSGDRYQYLEIAGRRHSHIIDPRSGLPLTDHSLTTVIAPDATTADSLATALNILGPQESQKILTKYKAAARWQRQSSKIETIESPDWKKHLAK